MAMLHRRSLSLCLVSSLKTRGKLTNRPHIGSSPYCNHRLDAPTHMSRDVLLFRLMVHGQSVHREVSCWTDYSSYIEFGTGAWAYLGIAYAMGNQCCVWYPQRAHCHIFIVKHGGDICGVGGRITAELDAAQEFCNMCHCIPAIQRQTKALRL